MPGLEKRFERFLSSSSSSHTLELLAENVDDEVAQEILHEEAGVLRLQNDSGMGFDTQCDFEHVDEDEGYDEDDTMEEVIEDITEQEMLQLLEEQEDSLEVARRLFFCQRPDQVSDQLQILSPDHLESLFQHGVVVIDGLFESSASSCVDDARSVALEMFANGQLQPASMVKENDDPFRDRTARDDWICW